MTNEQLTKTVIAHGEKISRIEEDIARLLETQSDIKDLTKSTHEIALGMKELQSDVKDVKGRITIVEDTQRSKNAAVWQIVMSVIISGIGTYVISNMLR